MVSNQNVFCLWTNDPNAFYFGKRLILEYFVPQVVFNCLSAIYFVSFWDGIS